MHTLDAQQLRRELLLEAHIQKQLTKIVIKANEMALKLKDNKAMEEHQLRNVLNVANETRTVEVVINFIRYQIARKKDAWGTKKDDFGHELIDILRTTLPKWTEIVLKEMQTQAPDQCEHIQAMRDTIQATLMQLFLGYLNRAFSYVKRIKESKELQVLHDMLAQTPGGNQ